MTGSRRWFRFTLRKLFVVVAVLAILAACVGHRLMQAHRQRDAIRELSLRGWDLMYDWQVTPEDDGPTHSSWFGETMLREIFGDDCCDNIVTAQIGNEDIPGDDELVLLRHFSELETVAIVPWQSNVTNKGIKELARANNIRRLLMSNCPVDDACVPDLLSMDNLRFLYLRNTEISDAGIRQLQAELERRGGELHVGAINRVQRE